MPISYNYKKIFIHVPRCGGNSVCKALNIDSLEELVSSDFIKHTSLFVEKKKFNLYEYNMCIYKSPQHLTYYELEKILPPIYFLNFSIFSIVRNPYERLVSEYKYLMNICKDEKYKIIEECSFESFLENLKMHQLDRNRKFNGHLETQTDYLVDSSGNISKNIKIYKFENIKECFDDILKDIKIEIIPWLKNTDNSVPYRTYYTEESAKIVANFYANDFKNFNYDTTL